MVSDTTIHLLELAGQARLRATRDPVRAARHTRITETLTKWAQKSTASGQAGGGDPAQPDEGICYENYSTD